MGYNIGPHSKVVFFQISFHQGEITKVHILLSFDQWLFKKLQQYEKSSFHGTLVP
jgi:hypothetical protein